MGTNYYVIKNACKCCNRYDEEYHIGKSSMGWAFTFQGYPYDQLTSWKLWKEFLKDKHIKDEYGDDMPYEKFVELIETYKAPGYKREDGHVNLSHYDEVSKSGYNMSRDWTDDLGYSFTTVEFS